VRLGEPRDRREHRLFVLEGGRTHQLDLGCVLIIRISLKNAGS